MSFANAEFIRTSGLGMIFLPPIDSPFERNAVFVSNSQPYLTYFSLTDYLLNKPNSATAHPADFEGLINAIPALIAKMDCNLRIVYANDRFYKLFGNVNHDSNFFHIAVGLPIFDQVQRHLGRVLVGQSTQFSISYESENGNRYLDISLSPQFDTRHQVNAIIFHALDITERMNDQRALHDYFENATIGLHWVNADGIIVWANPAELNMLGYKEHEYVGHPIAEFHKDQATIHSMLARLSRGEILRNFEAEMLCRDGSSKFVSINSSVLWDGNKFIHTRCFTIDITARKLAAQAMQESEQRFKILADLVPLVIWTTDENGMWTFLNGQWKELTGKDTADGIGTQWLTAVYPDDQENIRISWNNSLARQSPFEAKFRMLNSAGSYTVCYANAKPRFDANNSFLGYTGTIQDFSNQEQFTASLEKMVLDRTNDLRIKNIELQKAQRELKAKNEELEGINHELSSFAHVASHDLQEPLRKIQTFTDRVLRTEADKFSPQGLAFMSKIESASGRMRALIRDILQYSKVNDAHTNTEPVDLNELVRSVLTEFEITIEDKKATIEIVNELPVVQVTQFQFHQVFLNLISNALKFSKPDIAPHIRISSCIQKRDEQKGLDAWDEFYMISIADNGIGFETEYSNRIFDMFSRLHNGKQFEGTGIGLAICKKIVEHHCGKLLAEGKPGVGATFTIYLPAHRITKSA